MTESELWRGKPEDARMAAWDPRDETEEQAPSQLRAKLWGAKEKMQRQKAQNNEKKLL